MIAADEAALICDFAETYHIYDFRALPARRAAVLACGLREDSRIMRKLSGVPASLQTMLLAMIADAVRILIWQNTRDGAKGRNKPKSILDQLAARGQAGETASFATAEEFEAWRSAMLGGDSNA